MALVASEALLGGTATLVAMAVPAAAATEAEGSTARRSRRSRRPEGRYCTPTLHPHHRNRHLTHADTRSHRDRAALVERVARMAATVTWEGATEAWEVPAETVQVAASVEVAAHTGAPRSPHSPNRTHRA